MVIWIDKKLQKGAMTGLTYLKRPKKSFIVGKKYNHHWIQLKEIILNSDI